MLATASLFLLAASISAMIPDGLFRFALPKAALLTLVWRLDSWHVPERLAPQGDCSGLPLSGAPVQEMLRHGISGPHIGRLYYIVASCLLITLNNGKPKGQADALSWLVPWELQF